MTFSKDFTWGVATAALQIEGATHEDGRGSCIWDDYCRLPGKIYNGHTLDMACDHYHRYDEDVRRMAELGVKAYRFSVSWPRILPGGVGEVNEKGLAFYRKLTDELLKYGITPYVTLYHWDLPTPLAMQGGWLNPESAAWFEEYTRVVVAHLGDKVKHWITLNEPTAFVGCGYYTGEHAPGLRLSRKAILQMTHNVLLAHGRSVRAIRSLCEGARIGAALTGGFGFPATDAKEDVIAARNYLFECVDHCPVFSLGWWADPIFLGRYPDLSERPDIQEEMPPVHPHDMEIISQSLDFFGLNYYQASPISFDKSHTPGHYRPNPYPAGYPENMLGWPINAEALDFILKEIYDRYEKTIYIFENGIAYNDTVSMDGRVHDANRIDYIRRHLGMLKSSIDKGVDIRGYFYWSLMDNFEWACGYRPRFGLIYTDYTSQQRIPKDSFYWYKDLIEKNCI